MYHVYVKKQATVKLSWWHPGNFQGTSQQKRKLHMSLASYCVLNAISKKQNEIDITNSYVVRAGTWVIQSYLERELQRFNRVPSWEQSGVCESDSQLVATALC